MSYFRNETFSKYVYFTDKDNVAIDPDSTTVTIYMPDGTTDTVTLTAVEGESGKYELNYNILEDAQTGDWKVLIHAEKGSWKERELLIFTVVEV
ncbi:hypothetical protein MUO79_01000 [Candidatus Bathyarchaeota archaeon]|nr:hypothetical protein [Candidatus Bathyarchaeota archaeon]